MSSLETSLEATRKVGNNRTEMAGGGISASAGYHGMHTAGNRLFAPPGGLVAPLCPNYRGTCLSYSHNTSYSKVHNGPESWLSLLSHLTPSVLHYEWGVALFLDPSDTYMNYLASKELTETSLTSLSEAS